MKKGELTNGLRAKIQCQPQNTFEVLHFFSTAVGYSLRDIWEGEQRQSHIGDRPIISANSLYRMLCYAQPSVVSCSTLVSVVCLISLLHRRSSSSTALSVSSEACSSSCTVCLFTNFIPRRRGKLSNRTPTTCSKLDKNSSTRFEIRLIIVILRHFAEARTGLHPASWEQNSNLSKKTINWHVFRALGWSMQPLAQYQYLCSLC